jgi:hypothetical protein
MSDATRSETARQNALARWGTRKLDGMIHELTERRDELGEPQLTQLRQLVDDEGDPR